MTNYISGLKSFSFHARNGYEVVQKHVRRRLRRWLCSKHKVWGWEYARFPNEYLHDTLGLVQLGAKGRRLLWANA